MIKFIHKNPTKRDDDTITLLFNAFVYENFEDFSKAKMNHAQGYKCSDCKNNYLMCKCEKCPDCKYDRCLCGIKKNQLRNEIIKFAKNNLSKKNIKILKDDLESAKNNYNQNIPQKYIDKLS